MQRGSLTRGKECCREILIQERHGGAEKEETWLVIAEIKGSIGLEAQRNGEKQVCSSNMRPLFCVHF